MLVVLLSIFVTSITVFLLICKIYSPRYLRNDQDSCTMLLIIYVTTPIHILERLFNMYITTLKIVLRAFQHIYITISTRVLVTFHHMYIYITIYTIVLVPFLHICPSAITINVRMPLSIPYIFSIALFSNLLQLTLSSRWCPQIWAFWRAKLQLELFHVQNDIPRRRNKSYQHPKMITCHVSHLKFASLIDM